MWTISSILTAMFPRPKDDRKPEILILDEPPAALDFMFAVVWWIASSQHMALWIFNQSRNVWKNWPSVRWVEYLNTRSWLYSLVSNTQCRILSVSFFYPRTNHLDIESVEALIDALKRPWLVESPWEKNACSGSILAYLVWFLDTSS